MLYIFFFIFRILYNIKLTKATLNLLSHPKVHNMQQNSQYQEAASKTLQTINVLHVNLMMNITDYWEIIHGVRISHITSLKAERHKNIPYVKSKKCSWTWVLYGNSPKYYLNFRGKRTLVNVRHSFLPLAVLMIFFKTLEKNWYCSTAHLPFICTLLLILPCKFISLHLKYV